MRILTEIRFGSIPIQQRTCLWKIYINNNMYTKYHSDLALAFQKRTTTLLLSTGNCYIKDVGWAIREWKMSLPVILTLQIRVVCIHIVSGLRWRSVSRAQILEFLASQQTGFFSETTFTGMAQSASKAQTLSVESPSCPGWFWRKSTFECLPSTGSSLPHHLICFYDFHHKEGSFRANIKNSLHKVWSWARDMLIYTLSRI